MIPKSVLFHWSKGADVRRKIVKLVEYSDKKQTPIFLKLLAEELNISHVAAKKHVDLLIEERYILPINPEGKPIYLKLDKKGKEVYKEFF